MAKMKLSFWKLKTTASSDKLLIEMISLQKQEDKFAEVGKLTTRHLKIGFPPSCGIGNSISSVIFLIKIS